MNTSTTTRHTWEFGTDELPRLRLQAHHADVVVHHTGEPGQTSVTLTADAAVDLSGVEARSEGREVVVIVPALVAADRPGFGFSLQIGGLTFGAGGTARVALEVQLPEAADLDLKVGGGDIVINGRSGDLRARTGGGDVRFDDAGDVFVHTGGGDVRLDSCRGATQVGTGAGDVSAHVVAGQWTARTGAGDIIVTVPPDVPVWQDLSSPLGDVTSRIGGRGEPAEGQDHIEITARTGTGDISLS